MLILGKVCTAQERMPCFFYSKIIIEYFICNTPADQVKEPGTFHSKLHSTLPLQSRPCSCLIPYRNVHARLVNIYPVIRCKSAICFFKHVGAFGSPISYLINY